MSTAGTYPVGVKPLGYEQVTVSSTALGLTVPAGAERAVFGVEAQPLRYTTDGTIPTASLGFLVKADVSFEIYGSKALRDFLAIKDDATDAILNVNYYGS